MMRTLTLLLGMATAVDCKSEGETEDLMSSSTLSGSNGSAGGFSATLSADLANTKGGSAKPAGSGTMGSGMAGSGMAGSGKTGSAMAGSAMAGSGMAGSAMAGSAGKSSGSAMAGSAAIAMTGSAAVATSGSASSAVPVPVPVVRAHLPVKTSPEIALIKLKLVPKWERDIDEPATFMRTVDAVTKEVTFVFHYGYDDTTAPKEREAYIKWLAEKKLLLPANPEKPLLNRQRGGGWYLEGVDGAGTPAFRYLLNYGDKRLLCYGPLYKDTGLGDTRDEVIIQAKAICESITL